MDSLSPFDPHALNEREREALKFARSYSDSRLRTALVEQARSIKPDSTPHALRHLATTALVMARRKEIGNGQE